MRTNRDKLKKFLIEELGITDINDFVIFDNTKAGSTSCIGFSCPEEIRYSKDKCSKCKYNSFWDKNEDLLIASLNDLKALQKEKPETEILIQTPEGKVSCKIKDAHIFKSIDGKLIIDSE